MKTIPLTQGKFALVDDEDFEYLSQFYWQALKRGINAAWHVKRTIARFDKTKTVYMHQEIMPSPTGLEIDHKNGDGLDNQKKNLRVVTRLQNTRGYRRLRTGKSSKFRGVSWFKRNKNWRAQIGASPLAGRIARKMLHLGYFKCEEDAARAYDKKALELFGEFANLNFP